MQDDNQKEDIEARLPTVGHTMLDREKLRMELCDLYRAAVSEGLGIFPQLEDVYVVGSFAEETAVKSASDIDIRFVVNEEPSPDQRGWIDDYCSHNWSDFVDTQGGLFGYVDVQTSESPPTDYESVRL